MPSSHLATWSIAAAAVIGVVTRPRNWSEAWWAVSGALALIAFSLVSPRDAGSAILKGSDVYLFLIGMMLLAEIARREGLFDWLAQFALRHARGSGKRLFFQVYVAGTMVTVFLSNDATAVVLTPAVFAIAKKAGAPPLPYLFICAFIANAASFVLPISNPANLVVFGNGMPPLRIWLGEFAAASVISVLATYALLWVSQRRCLPSKIAVADKVQPMPIGARITLGAIAVTTVVLLVSSIMGWDLGLPTCLSAAAVCLGLSAWKQSSPVPLLRGISWSVLPLVAGLFVLVQAVEGTGAIAALSNVLQHLPGSVSGSAVALASNLINNLPMGLICATAVHSAHLSTHLTGALLIGVDLGPNLSITGSLATILWLMAIRREGANVTAGQFLRVGCFVMPLSLLATLGVYNLLSST